MSEPSQRERLLADVLGEGISADFRQGLLRETLHLARRRRRVRQARSTASVLALLTAFGFLVWHQLPSGRSPSGFPARPYAIVRTQLMPSVACVETRPFPASSIIASVRADHIVLTAEDGVQVRALTDEELLAAVSKPAALVRFSPPSAELVFVNEVDRQELLGN